MKDDNEDDLSENVFHFLGEVLKMFFRIIIIIGIIKFLIS